jgi:uncharacterized protein
MLPEFIYVTDLHGCIPKYENVLAFAIEHKVKLIHLGADLLPKGEGLLKRQKKFVKTYLKEFYTRCKSLGIDVLAFFGNDDVYTRKQYFREYATLLDEVPFLKDGWEFRAYGYVPIYPWPLRTACKLDYEGDDWDRTILTKDAGPEGLYVVQEPEVYFRDKGTIEDDLKTIKGHSKLIMAIHCPPIGVNLDVCDNGRRAGSKSVLEWIEREQPLMTLHGHIHENYEMTKMWKCSINQTVVVQPGQRYETTDFVYVEPDRSTLVSVKEI